MCFILNLSSLILALQITTIALDACATIVSRSLSARKGASVRKSENEFLFVVDDERFPISYSLPSSVSFTHQLILLNIERGSESAQTMTTTFGSTEQCWQQRNIGDA